MALSLQEVKELKRGDHVYYVNVPIRPGPPKVQRWRVNGKAKTWLTKPEKVEVPIIHGLYSHTYITQENMHSYYRTEMEAIYACDLLTQKRKQ